MTDEQRSPQSRNTLRGAGLSLGLRNTRGEKDETNKGGEEGDLGAVRQLQRERENGQGLESPWL